MEALLSVDALIALVTLTVLEVVLGVDNVIFISILAGKLPPGQQDRARRVGLLAAMGMRIALLFSIAWIVRLTAPLFTVLGQEISGRELDYTLSEDARIGDHQLYVSDFTDFEADYPEWQLTFGIDEVLRDIYESNVERWAAKV